VTSGSDKVKATKAGDMWTIEVNDYEHYQVSESVISGGWTRPQSSRALRHMPGWKQVYVSRLSSRRWSGCSSASGGILWPLRPR